MTLSTIDGTLTAIGGEIVGLGPSFDPALLPTYVGASNVSHLSGFTATLPVGTQPGDYVMAVAMGVGGGTITPSGTGWEVIGDQGAGGQGAVYVKGKYVQPGDTTFTLSWSLVGIGGLVVYRNVVGVHASKGQTTGAHSTTLTPPAGWANVPLGSMALLFSGVNDTQDYPLHHTIPGWRRDLDWRRWDYGGAAFVTYDPDLWKNPIESSALWSTQGLLGVLLIGPQAVEGTIDEVYPSISRPSVVTSGAAAWNAATIQCPAAAQVDDLFIFWHYRSTVVAPVGQGDQGWWGLINSWNGGSVVAHARFVKAGEPGVANYRKATSNDQTPGYLVLRGVNRHFPFRRRIAAYSGTDANAKTVPTYASSPMSTTLAVGGLNIGSAEPNVTLSGPWSHTSSSNRWPPFAWMGVHVPAAEGANVVGLAWDFEGSGGANAEVVEIRGAA